MNSQLAYQVVVVPIIRSTKETASTVSAIHLLLEAAYAYNQTCSIARHLPLHLYSRRLTRVHPHRHTSLHRPCQSVFHPHLHRHTSRPLLHVVIASWGEATAKRRMVHGAMSSQLAYQAVVVPIIRSTQHKASIVSVTHLLREEAHAYSRTCSIARHLPLHP